MNCSLPSIVSIQNTHKKAYQTSSTDQNGRFSDSEYSDGYDFGDYAKKDNKLTNDNKFGHLKKKSPKSKQIGKKNQNQPKTINIKRNNKKQLDKRTYSEPLLQHQKDDSDGDLLELLNQYPVHLNNITTNVKVNVISRKQTYFEEKITGNTVNDLIHFVYHKLDKIDRNSQSMFVFFYEKQALTILKETQLLQKEHGPYYIYLPQYEKKDYYDEMAVTADKLHYYPKFDNDTRSLMSTFHQVITEFRRKIPPQTIIEILDEEHPQQVTQNSRPSQFFFEDTSILNQFREVKCNKNELNRTMSNDFNSLIKNLQNLESCFGGSQYAYDVEWKVRFFVATVLMYAFQHNGNLRLDGENQIKQFNKKIAPDLQIISNEKGQTTTLYIIEVKKMINRSNNVNQNNQKIEEFLSQNFKQMRHYCIQNRQLNILGVLTNYKEWYFTKYSFIKEVENSIDQHKHGSQIPQQFQMSTAFEISQKFNIMSEHFDLDCFELQKVLNILENLSNTFYHDD